MEMRTELPYLKREMAGQFQAQREYMDHKFAAMTSSVQMSPMKTMELSVNTQWVGIGVGVVISNLILILALWAAGAFG